MRRFDQATAAACSPTSSSSRSEAEWWPSRSTVLSALSSMINASWCRGRTGKARRCFGSKLRDGLRPCHPDLRGESRQLRPTSMIWDGGVNRHGHRLPRYESRKTPTTIPASPCRSGRPNGDRRRGRPLAGTSDSAGLLAELARTRDLQAGPRSWRQSRFGRLLASGRLLLNAYSGHGGAWPLCLAVAMRPGCETAGFVPIRKSDQPRIGPAACRCRGLQ